MIMLKLLVCSLLAFSVYYLYKTATLGRKIARGGAQSLVGDHQGSTSGVLCTTIGAVVLLEFIMRAPGLQISPVPQALLAVHLFFAFLFLGLLLLSKFWITGRANPRLHRPFAYAMFGSYAVALPTGLVMLYTI